MITAYAPSGNVLAPRSVAKDEEIPRDSVWIDLLSPDDAEEAQVEAFLGADIPTREEVESLEASMTLYRRGATVYGSAHVLANSAGARPSTTSVAFVLIGSRLVTVRYDDPRPFAIFAQRAGCQDGTCRDGAATLAGLLDAIVGRAADILEEVQVMVDDLSQELFTAPPQGGRRAREDAFLSILMRIGRAQILTSKARESLASLGRLLGFLQGFPEIVKQAEASIPLDLVARDAAQLREHAGYLSTNATFLLDATLGMINIAQNGIIKILSVAAVIFLPPTLIASVYGMNFEHMPELAWTWGYPLVGVLMVASATGSYWWFKRRGWL